MKKALFIGGTGTISAAVSRRVAADPQWELYLLNRGNRTDVIPENARIIKADVNDVDDLRKKILGMDFDCVCDFIGFVPANVERDWNLFKGHTGQYMYISSASAYIKPVRNCIVNEKTPLVNPFWQYSRDKIACENFLMEKFREERFPVTIIRPSHTYDERTIPVGLHGGRGSWQVVQRIIEGKKIIVHGDGTSLWTMTHNSDFAKGFFGLMGNSAAIGESYQITSDETLTWNQIYSTIASVVGAEFRPCYAPSEFLAAVDPGYDLRGKLLGDKACPVIFDNSKLKAAVPDFKATVPYAEGIARSYEYIKKHPECQKADPEFDQWCDRVVNAMETARNAMSNR